MGNMFAILSETMMHDLFHLYLTEERQDIRETLNLMHLGAELFCPAFQTVICI